MIDVRLKKRFIMNIQASLEEETVDADEPGEEEGVTKKKDLRVKKE